MKNDLQIDLEEEKKFAQGFENEKLFVAFCGQ